MCHSGLNLSVSQISSRSVLTRFSKNIRPSIHSSIQTNSSKMIKEPLILYNNKITFSAKLITMINDKQLVLYQGYTFYKQYDRKNLDKWHCTSQPKCKAYLITDKDLIIHQGSTEHNHRKKQLIENSMGRYIRI